MFLSHFSSAGFTTVKTENLLSLENDSLIIIYYIFLLVNSFFKNFSKNYITLTLMIPSTADIFATTSSLTAATSNIE